ncbi:adenylyltransferase/cytidyltransferase family protein [Paremcibacter congregatus]|jgi:glycerol-3-phosphate cytidylyltransferase|uniref:adenylyltransferase/cytidyltransferase family protein n=1 Tax=Paremcibacter congregatus TaxID=2043170 RepID=UPI0030ED564F|tara:strand:+ start:102 stop:494 length:393 start_codon:yes stop_codon:yes gene_type:complete
MKRIITFGTFDVFHIGHLRILQRSRDCGDYLIVGVSSDRMNFNKKDRYPVIPQNQRREIVQSLKCVDEVFFEESLDLKGQYILENKADVLVMGDDWAGRFDEFKNICDVIYLPRTPSVSTTSLIEIIKEI